MNFDELKECTRCGSDACYKQEISKDINIEMCYGCGFQHNSIMVQGSDFFKEQMELLPDLYKVLIDEEEESGKIWIPSTINVEDKGMVSAQGNSRDNWKWGAVKVMKVEPKDSKRYKGAKFRADMTTLQSFNERDFMEALSYIEVIPE